MDQEIESHVVEGENQPEMTLREQLEKNRDEIRDRQEAEAGADDAAVSVADKGAAVAGEKKEVPAEIAEQTAETKTGDTQAAVPTQSKAPTSWTPAEKGIFDKLPPEAQDIIARREADVSKGFAKMGQDAEAGRRFNEAINPYLPLIRSEGGEPVAAVRDLLNTAYVLRTATPERKVALFHQLAQQFNVDLAHVATHQPRQIDPEVLQLRQQLEQVQGHLVGQHHQQVQQTQAEVQRQIEAFSSDPKHEFFDAVRGHMGALIANGLAADLEQAYEQACHANPDVRSTLQQRSAAAAEAKRQEDARVKANAKRRAGSSIAGSPGANVQATTGNENLSLRDQLRAGLRAATAS